MRALLAGSFDAPERDEWLRGLQDALPEVQWVVAPAAAHEAPHVEVAVVANPPPGTLQGLPRLQLIQSLWAGVDRLLADPTLPPGVPIARMVDPAMGEAMAQTALWAVLSLHRGFFAYAAQQRQGLWRPLPQRRADELHQRVGRRDQPDPQRVRPERHGVDVQHGQDDGQAEHIHEDDSQDRQDAPEIQMVCLSVSHESTSAARLPVGQRRLQPR